MERIGTAMGRLILTMVACVGFAVAGNAETISGGKITAANDGAKSFVYRGKTKEWTFKTNDKTVIKVGRKKAGWPDIKTGQTVSIRFHQEGGERVAEQIVLMIGVGF
jgi:Domain of unknown function (DUF5666)